MSIIVDEAPMQEQPITETQVETQETQEVEAVAEAVPEYEVPTKYAGKSMQEVIEMHQNAESAFGKQGSEV